MERKEIEEKTGVGKEEEPKIKDEVLRDQIDKTHGAVIKRVERRLKEGTGGREDKEKGLKKIKDELKGFLPTDVTRTSPFSPMRRSEMKRKRERITWSQRTSWGEITCIGPKLSIYDESLLIAIMNKTKERKSEGIIISRYELCKELGVTPCRDTYRAIEQSIKNMTETTVGVTYWKKDEEHVDGWIVCPILSGVAHNKNSGEYKITISPYFIKMIDMKLITYLDVNLRKDLKGDTTKALYRFYVSHSSKELNYKLDTIAGCINLNSALPKFKIREAIKKALKRLRISGYLEDWHIKNDVVGIRKGRKQKKR